MGKKDRGNFHRKRAQKIAKQKVKKVRERSSTRQRVPLEYTGARYQSPRYTLPLMMVELGIRNADRASGGKLLDSGVRCTLAFMVKQLHNGPQDVVEGLVALRELPFDDADQRRILASIVDEWLAYFEHSPRLSRADAVGILRTLVHSLDVRTEMRPNGRGYLHFLEEFLPETNNSLPGDFDASLIDLRSSHEEAFEDAFSDHGEDDDALKMPFDSRNEEFGQHDAIDVQHRAPSGLDE